MRHISILGSTGSIGTQTLDVVRCNQDIKVEALAVDKNITLLLEQIKEFQPKLVCVYNAEKAKEAHKYDELQKILIKRCNAVSCKLFQIKPAFLTFYSDILWVLFYNAP